MKTIHGAFIVLTIIIALLGVGVSRYVDDEQSVPHTEAQVPLNQNEKELSTAQYVAIKEEFILLAKTHDPKFALTALRERIKTDTALLRTCHVLVHEIGHAAYDMYKDFGVSLLPAEQIQKSV